MDSPDDPLQRLVKAAKEAPTPHEESPPSPEVSTLREGVRITLLTLTWRKISLIAALVAGITFVIFYSMIHKNEEHPTSVPIPHFPETP